MSEARERTDKVFAKYPVIKELTDLVHGSGIDYEWYAKDNEEAIILYNSFHAMNDVGMYAAVCPFHIRIPKQGFMNFRVYGSRDGRYWFERNDLRQYISDTVAFALGDIINAHKNTPPFKSGIRTRTEYDLVPMKPMAVQPC